MCDCSEVGADSLRRTEVKRKFTAAYICDLPEDARRLLVHSFRGAKSRDATVADIRAMLLLVSCEMSHRQEQPASYINSAKIQSLEAVWMQYSDEICC